MAIPVSSSLQVKVSLGEILNPKLPPDASAGVCVNVRQGVLVLKKGVCDWVNEACRRNCLEC